MKNLNLWNQACTTKAVWAIAKKKDNLWVQWFHRRYIKEKEWWDYTPRGDSSWYWKKMQRVKQRFQTYPRGEYKVKEGYIWLLQNANKIPWSKIIWSRASIPRHSITTWLLMHQKLPILQRLARYTQLQSTEWRLCQQNLEMQEHLFIECQFATDIQT